MEAANKRTGSTEIDSTRPKQLVQRRNKPRVNIGDVFEQPGLTEFHEIITNC